MTGRHLKGRLLSSLLPTAIVRRDDSSTEQKHIQRLPRAPVKATVTVIQLIYGGYYMLGPGLS